MRVLTGITTTGAPHIGNYVGAIRPAIQESKKSGNTCFFFLADNHALIKCRDPKQIQNSTKQVAAAWLAAGLDPAQTYFYRQSDIPEIFELAWMLSCVSSKGLLNRAHAYKAAVDTNLHQDQDMDFGITMGLFSYPVLMAADILLFNAQKVPVGRDQIQHIEIARDIGTRFNHIYGGNFFHLPETVVSDTEVLPGLDGRKMSKTYQNTIPLFEGGHKALKNAIAKIKTDSLRPGDPKNPDSNPLCLIFECLTGAEQANYLRSSLVDGMGWGDAKKEVLTQIESFIGPMRNEYDKYMSRPEMLDDILQDGAQKVRALARSRIEQLREVVGICKLTK